MKNRNLFILAFLMLLGNGFLMGQGRGIVIKGSVVDGQSGLAIEFATLVAKSKVDDKVIAGTTSVSDGTFEFMASQPNFYIECSFIGFETQKITNFTRNKGMIDLGVIALESDSEVLDEVVVRAEKSQTVFKLDKRIFNVGQDLSSTGASALELLNNVPSVNVNIEGEISLRGSTGVQILINGKPSVLAGEGGNALGTITADMIDRIEVITNPSAKHEAEGTSGIINIVIKKDERKGINGSISVNTGTPHNHSLGLSMNRRTEKFNLFSQLGVGYRELPRDNENINTNLISDTTIYSTGREYRNEVFYNVILGTDYYINPTNVVTLSGSFAYEVEDQPSRTDFELREGDEVLDEWYRTETTEAGNPKWQYELQYKSDFKDYKDHEFLFSALGNFFGKEQSSEFEDVYSSGIDYQRTATDFSEAKYTFKADYTKPFSKKVKMEMGGQYVLQDVSNDYEVTDLIDTDWVIDEHQTNVFKYNQKVLGLYATGAFEADKWGVKGGLRMENTDLYTLLTNTGKEDNQNYTNFFPSLHTSYKFSEAFSIQAGYSRRIYRPRLWDLNPFFNIRNQYSIRTGNPELLPEYTDSYEFNSIYIIKDASLNFGVYHRYTTDVVERVGVFEDNVTIFKPLNIGTNRTTGLEFNAKYSFKKWLVLTGDFNYNYFNRIGAFEGVSFDFNGDQWQSKLTSKFKLPADFDVEITGRYRSAVKTVQGNTSANIFADFGVRKKIVGGKAVLSLSVRDVFASRFRETEILQDDYYVYSFGQRGRFIRLGFSYGFGKGEAMQYTGRRHH